MSDYREFQGKTLDEAIRDACSFYDTPREKLEIDIVSDAKGGIFGLVGARKALIKARRVELGSVLDGLEAPSEKVRRREEPESPPRSSSVPQPPARSKGVVAPQAPQAAAASQTQQPRNAAQPAPQTVSLAPAVSAPLAEHTEQVAQPEAARPERTSSRRGRAGRKGPGTAPEPSAGVAAQGNKQAPKEGRDARNRRGRTQDQPRDAAKNGGPKETAPKRKERPARGNSAERSMDRGAFSAAQVDALDGAGDELPRVPFDQLDAEQLQAVTREVAGRLTLPLLGEATFEVTCAADRVRISFSGLEDPGLLIGRDGQTLASLQYLATRMVSNRMKALVRVQIDAGDYRERQDERLRDLALSLAEKVKAGGRPQLTRPLSSYHRRVIHMTLQEDPLVQTHSKGEGEMKRVVVTLRRKPAA